MTRAAAGRPARNRVTTRRPISLDDIRAARDNLGVARFKWPEHLVFVEELATTPVGKIDKKALRADITRRLSPEVRT